MNWEEFLKEAAARADKNSRDDWTNVEGSNEPFSSLSCNPFSPERFFLAGPLRSYWLPVLLLQCNEKRLRYFFFPPPPLLRPSSPSSQFSRRIIASSIIYEISYQIPNIPYIFRKKYIYIHSSNETIRKERKEKRKEIFLKIWSKWTNFSYISRKIKISIDSNWRGGGKKKKKLEGIENIKFSSNR